MNDRSKNKRIKKQINEWAHEQRVSSLIDGWTETVKQINKMEVVGGGRETYLVGQKSGWMRNRMNADDGWIDSWVDNWRLDCQCAKG